MKIEVDKLLKTSVLTCCRERLRDPAKSSLCALAAMLSGNASSARNSRRTFVTEKVGFSLIDKYFVKVWSTGLQTLNYSQQCRSQMLLNTVTLSAFKSIDAPNSMGDGGKGAHRGKFARESNQT